MTARVIAIVLAGGSGTRMRTAAVGPDGSDAPSNKVHLMIAGRPILAYSVSAFEACALVTDIVLVVRAGDEEATGAVLTAVSPRKLRAVVEGGATRQASELAGLAAVREFIAGFAPGFGTGLGAEPGTGGDPDQHDQHDEHDEHDEHVVLIHDGARPFVGHELIERLVVAARAHGGALPGLAFDTAVVEVAVEPAGETARQAAAEPTGSRIRRVDATSMRRVQTPQAFRLGPLLAAYDVAAATSGFDGVDTADTVQRFAGGAGERTRATSGYWSGPPIAVAVVAGDVDNLKVTTPDDLPRAEAIARRRSQPVTNRTS